MSTPERRGEEAGVIKSSSMIQKIFGTSFSVLKAELNLVPVVGGSVASIVGDIEAVIRQKKTEEWVRRLLADLKEETTERFSVMEDRLETIEFLLETKNIYVTSSDTTKQDFAVGLAHSALSDGCNLEMDFLLSRIGLYSGIHLDLLRLYYDPGRAFEHRGRQTPPAHTRLEDIFNAYFGNVDLEIIRAAQNDLFAAHLVGNDGGSFGVTTAATGMQRAETMLKPLGRRMVERCHPWLK